MPTLAEIQALADELQTSLDAEQLQVSNLLAEKDNTIATLNQTITELQAIIDAGGDPAQFQAIHDKLTSLKTDLESTIPEGGEPEEPEVPEEPETPEEPEEPLP